MKIVFNNTLSILNYEGNQILPGSNVVESFNEKHPIIGLYINSGEIEVIDSEKATEREKKKALNEANSIKTVKALKALYPKIDVSKQEQKIESFGKAVKEALKKEENKEE